MAKRYASPCEYGQFFIDGKIIETDICIYCLEISYIEFYLLTFDGKMQHLLIAVEWDTKKFRLPVGKTSIIEAIVLIIWTLLL